MKFSRRNFLQSIGISVTSWGVLNNSIFCADDNAYGAPLPNSRKLALLVGINQYSHGKNLRGCSTDVELQKELLIHRFGFSPSDIVTLLDGNATREKILETFQQHLIQQAQNNDVVIFHFSGYGRQVQLNQDESSSQNSLITYDSIKSNNNFVEDILFDTIVKLAQSLKTNKYTFILDTSFISSTPSLSNQFSLRSYQSSENPVINQKEIEFNTLLPKNNNSLSGLILSPSPNSSAVEINSLNFHVGLFTYALTQSLWQNCPQTDNLNLMKKIAFQVALASGNGETVFFSDNNNKFLYNLPLINDTQGEAIITNFIEPNIVELELLGLPLLVLYNYQNNSYFTGIDNEKNITILINSIQGNKAKGVLINTSKDLITKGLIVQESIRVIDRNTGLTVGLNNSLEKIEKVDATSALSAVNNIKSVVNLGDNFADCIFGKFINQNNSIEGYGLFSTAGILFPNTYPKVANEAVSSAVKRLTPAFKVALTEKLLHLTFNNPSSSDLSIDISLEIHHDNKTFIHPQTTNQTEVTKSLISSTKSIDNQEKLLINIPLGSQFTMTINNNNNHDLYYLLLGINSSRQAIAYFSPNLLMLKERENILIPENTNPLKWLFNGEKGTGELILICAKSPFNETLNELYKITNMKPDNEQIILLENPVTIAKAILQDLHLGSNISSNLVSNLSDVYALDLNNWVTFNFVYEIINS